jgi:squalene synthase HpnC
VTATAPAPATPRAAARENGFDAAAEAVRRHDENFPVAFLLLPRALRADMHAVYAFCRATDDLGDEGDPAVRMARLEQWAADLERCFGGVPRDPRLRALAATVARRDLPAEPFRRLVEANRMDQRHDRWPTYADLLDYCEHSATPVGRMVLGVLGYRDEWRAGMSDATCIGLQLANFWQDVRRDLDDRGRIYLPLEDMERFGVPEDHLRRPRATPALRDLMAFEVDRARGWLLEGAPLAHVVPRRVGLDIRMFTAGGLAICDAIARQDHDTLVRRPAPGKLGRARIAAAVLWRTARGRPEGAPGQREEAVR